MGTDSDDSFWISARLEGWDGGGGLTDRRAGVGSAEGEGATTGGTKDFINGEFRICRALPEMGPTVRNREKPTVREMSSP